MTRRRESDDSLVLAVIRPFVFGLACALGGWLVGSIAAAVLIDSFATEPLAAVMWAFLIAIVSGLAGFVRSAWKEWFGGDEPRRRRRHNAMDGEPVRTAR